jgi:hypothetical protein
MMSGEELQRAADQLAERAIVRAQAIDAWASLALEQCNPIEWTDALVAAALDRLETNSLNPTVRAEARLQLRVAAAKVGSFRVRTGYVVAG